EEPSPVRAAIIAAAAASPAAVPSVLPRPSGIAASAVCRLSSRVAAWAGNSQISTPCAAAIAAASGFAPEGALGVIAQYGSYLPEIELTASKTAPCTAAIARVEGNGGVDPTVSTAIWFHWTTTASPVDSRTSALVSSTVIRSRPAVSPQPQSRS